MTHLVDGRAIATACAAQTAAAAAALRARGFTPTLAVLLPTDDPGAAWYVRSLQRAAARTGVACQVHRMGAPVGAEQIAGRLAELSLDPAVHGVICQTPLPAGVGLSSVGTAIPVGKDVDGANPASLGALAAGLPGVFAPATAAAVLAILRHERVPLSGRRAVVVGRSTVVGKPAALLLLAEHAMDGGGLAGDVDAAAVTGIASVLTPVPGGVGPVTTAVLLQQTAEAAGRAAAVPG